MSSRPVMYTLTEQRPRPTGPVLNVHSEYSVGSAELASPDMGSASDCPPHPDPVCSQPFDPSPYEPTRWYDAALVAAQAGPVVAANVAGAAFLVACRCPLPCPDPDPVGVAGQHLAVVHDRDPLAELLGLLHVVGGEQDRLAGRVQRPQRVPQVDPGLRVDAGGRLVQEQHLGP